MGSSGLHGKCLCHQNWSATLGTASQNQEPAVEYLLELQLQSEYTVAVELTDTVWVPSQACLERVNQGAAAKLHCLVD